MTGYEIVGHEIAGHKKCSVYSEAVFYNLHISVYEFNFFLKLCFE